MLNWLSKKLGGKSPELPGIEVMKTKLRRLRTEQEEITSELSSNNIQAVKAHEVRERLAHLKCPKVVDIHAALPRHQTGKLYKELLKKPHWGA